MAQKKSKKEEQQRIAVVLFNLGGPTSKEVIQPFLYKFLSDKNIIRAPALIRKTIAGLVAYFRSRGEALEAYGEMGGQSPLLKNTLAQQDALQAVIEKKLKGHIVKTYTCMCYWHPMADSVVPMVQAFEPDKVILVSLYPQFSTTTFKSSLEEWDHYSKEYGLKAETSVLCCYPKDDGFIKASVKNVGKAINKCLKKTGQHPRVLFSAHSLPESYVDDGDPYAWQCEQTVIEIANRLKLKKKDYRVCYQSKIGPQKWLGPQTEDEIIQAGHDGVPIIIYPHAFVSEHVETIVELGIEYKEVAEEEGVTYYDVVPTVMTDKDFIKGLSQQILAILGRKKPRISSGHENGRCLCPKRYGDCCQRTFESGKNGLQSRI